MRHPRLSISALLFLLSFNVALADSDPDADAPPAPPPAPPPVQSAPAAPSATPKTPKAAKGKNANAAATASSAARSLMECDALAPLSGTSDARPVQSGGKPTHSKMSAAIPASAARNTGEPPVPLSAAAATASSAAAAATTASVAAPAPSVSGNTALFPPTLFPGLQRHGDADFVLAGMAAIYSGRVVRGKPAPVPAASSLPPRAPVLDTLADGVEYIRCHPGALNLAAAAAPEPPPAGASRIIDLRYFATAPEDAAAAAALCERLTGARPRYNAQGRYPLPPAAPQSAAALAPPAPVPPDAAPPLVLVLVNAGTSGPVEAMLADLRLRRKILLVGVPTAGRTAHLEELPAHPNWWGIVGEVQPGERAESLVATGVAPDATVAVTPEGDLLAWLRVEKGERPSALLRTRRGETTAAATSSNAAAAKTGDDSTPPESGAPDLVLRRAHDLANALSLRNTLAAPDAAAPAAR